MSEILRIGALKLHELITGRRVLARVQELESTQWLGRDELLKLQRNKLQRLVEYAYQYVPYYRRTFDRAGFHPDDLCRDLASLSQLPVLTKAIIRENFDDMLSTESTRRKQLSKVVTSGSTGHPLVFLQDNYFRDSVTADIQRHLSWAGWRMGQPHAYIWGANFEVDRSKLLRNRMIDWVWNRFVVNAFILNDQILADFAEQIRRRNPRILFGYASSLYRFAQFVQSDPYRDVTFDGVFSSAEVLLPAVRQFIEDTFQCKVFNRYGTKELGGIACECEAHIGLHLSAENNYVEILSNDRPANVGEVGNIIVTNLNNFGMPFIRYSVEDGGAWYNGGDCPCGRAAPLLETVQGRIVETFKTRDGRTAWAGFAGAGYSGLAHPAIKQFQIVQKSLDLMVVRLIKDGELPQSTLDELTQTFQIAFGDDVQIKFEFPDEIPVLPSGKHQYAISMLEE